MSKYIMWKISRYSDYYKKNRSILFVFIDENDEMCVEKIAELGNKEIIYDVCNPLIDSQDIYSSI